MNLKEKLIKIRKDNNLTQEELADKLFVSRQTVSNWENGKFYPDIETLILFSDTFNISLDELLKSDAKVIKDIDKKIKSHKKLLILLIVLSIIFISSLIIGYKYHKTHKEVIIKTVVPENHTMYGIDDRRISNKNIDSLKDKKIDIYIDDHDIDIENLSPIATNAEVHYHYDRTVLIIVSDNDFITLKQYEAEGYNFKLVEHK